MTLIYKLIIVCSKQPHNWLPADARKAKGTEMRMPRDNPEFSLQPKH